jgi:hypothetical protein
MGRKSMSTGSGEKEQPESAESLPNEINNVRSNQPTIRSAPEKNLFLFPQFMNFICDKLLKEGKIRDLARGLIDGGNKKVYVNDRPGGIQKKGGK